MTPISIFDSSADDIRAAMTKLLPAAMERWGLALTQDNIAAISIERIAPTFDVPGNEDYTFEGTRVTCKGKELLSPNDIAALVRHVHHHNGSPSKPLHTPIINRLLGKKEEETDPFEGQYTDSLPPPIILPKPFADAPIALTLKKLKRKLG